MAVPITAGSGTSIRTVTPATDHQQVGSVADATTGKYERHDPDGTIQVSPQASALFLDDFSGTLATNHTTGGTAPTSTGGTVTANSGTTASATSYMRSVPGFLLRPGSYVRTAWNIRVDTGAVTNSTRWWGHGINAATPTSAAPVTNGVVFEIAAADGLLYAVTYAGGTRTQIAALTRPTDGLFHRYEIWFRQSALQWVIDGTLVAEISSTSVSYPQLTQVLNLATIFGAANASTAPASAPVLQATSVTVTDQSGYHKGIGDGLLPYLFATVKTAQSPAPAATDNQLVVQAMPAPSQTVTATAATGVAATATLPAPAAGLRHYVTSWTLEQYATAATTGSATPIVTTATNHALVTTLSTALAIGQVVKDVRVFDSPLAATAQATATTFTAPATTGIIWRITVTYYTAP